MWTGFPSPRRDLIANISDGRSLHVCSVTSYLYRVKMHLKKSRKTAVTSEALAGSCAVSLVLLRRAVALCGLS
jgi:hypothetical protein